MKTKLLVVLFMGLSLIINGQNGLPIQVDNSKIMPLSSLKNSYLQNNLERQLNANPNWKKLIAENKMSVGIVDLSNPEQVRYASVNGEYMMYAASLPKIAILLSAMDAIEKGELKETTEVKNDMRLMISKSNNAASTRMIDRLGYEKIESVMTDPKYMFYDEDCGGGLWVGKRYGSGGDTNREPLKHLSHAATVDQVCRYYYLLAYGKLVNNKRSKQMLAIMGNPDLHHKFVNSLEKIAPQAQLFRKSGSWQTYHSDSILVWGNDPNRRYILVALIDDANGEQIIRSLVNPIENALKKKERTKIASN
ncbi:serine hydrolase [uncultured Formosa sp.]|uniref:serine hydrolase n=1 Tax=uncultured Formosa sp. TaxID=255435 RepID=UPI0026097AF5|nr:serine hydrolase [uncultured Formosa sp.]